MDTETTTTETDIFFPRLRRVGAAIGRVNGNNTHSGNLSIRDPHDPDLFYITATGCQCGSLIERDIVPVRFSEVSWGDARGSTESTTTRSATAWVRSPASTCPGRSLVWFPRRNGRNEP